MNFFSDKRIVGLFAYLLGLTITLQAFKFDLFGANVYPWNLFYYPLPFILAVFGLMRAKKTPVFKNGIYLYIAFVLFFTVVALSCFVPLMDGAGDAWVFASNKGFIKLIFLSFFASALFFSSDRLKTSYFGNFFKGFISAVILQLVFSIAQMILWYANGINLNRWFFLDVLHVDPGHVWGNFIIYPILRATGFHWDPAYLAMWLAIGMIWIYLFWQKGTVKKMFLFASLAIFVATFSRAVFLAFFIIMALSCFLVFVRKAVNNRLKFKLLIATPLGIAVLSISFFVFGNNDIFGEIWRERTNISAEGTQRHISYFFEGARVISYFPRFLFGFGYRNSGRGLLENDSTAFALPGIDNFVIPWSPESDLVNVYLGMGLAGLFAYSVLFISLFYYIFNLYFKISKIKKLIGDNDRMKMLKKKIIFFSFMCGILLLSGVFYSFIDNEWYWLLLFGVFWCDAELRSFDFGKKTSNDKL